MDRAFWHSHYCGCRVVLHFGRFLEAIRDVYSMLDTTVCTLLTNSILLNISRDIFWVSSIPKVYVEDQIDREGVRFRSAEETEHFQKHVSNHDVSTLPIYRAVVKNIDCSLRVYIPRKLKKVGMRISIRWYFGTFLNKVRSLIHLDSLLSKFKEFAKSYDQ